MKLQPSEADVVAQRFEEKNKLSKDQSKTLRKLIELNLGVMFFLCTKKGKGLISYHEGHLILFDYDLLVCLECAQEMLKPLNEEKTAFTLFDPFLTSQVKKMGENKDWCFGFRQVIRPTMPWYACFKKQESALRCYQKVSRLQRHLRQKKPKGELYRPGEIVANREWVNYEPQTWAGWGNWNMLNFRYQ